MRRWYQAGSLIFFFVALYIIWQAHGLNYYTSLGPGPGFFPFWLGLSLAILCIVWFCQVTFRPVEDMAPDFIPDRAGLLRVISLFVALVLVVALIGQLGYRITMLFFLLFVLTVLGRQNLILTLVLALGGSWGLFYVFQQWLDVRLPEASIEFLQALGM